MDKDTMLFIIMLCVVIETCSTHDQKSTRAIERQTEIASQEAEKNATLLREQTKAIEALNRTLQERIPAR